MASPSDLNDDAYVASLLAKDARDSSIRYSALGLQALLPKRPTSKAPKPNTRFLKSIIRDTDNHNAALKKKEELEARMRAKGLPLSASRSESAGYGRLANVKSRNGAHSAYESSKTFRRESSPEHRSREQAYRSGRSDRSRRQENRHYSHRDLSDDETEDHHRRLRWSERDHTGHGKRGRSKPRSTSLTRSTDRHHKRRRRRSRSYSSDEDRRHRKRRGRSRSRSRSRSSRSRKKSDKDTAENNTTAGKANGLRRLSDAGTKRRHSSVRSSSSDPLEDLVGPLPPKESANLQDPPPFRSRGRGAHRHTTSTIDSHFDSLYNPSLDLHPESELEDEKEDWDMALEALRDRELWKQKGAERLRAAGFGDTEIRKWEDSGREKGAEDVTWTAKGQSREWDIGKVVEPKGAQKGEISLEAAWKRKGGGFMKDFRKALG